MSRIKTSQDYAKIKELLEAQESFPIRFTYKFIGRNTLAFSASVSALEAAFPSLRHEMSRESSGGAHVSKTYSFEAASADAIIDIYRAIELVDDLMIVL